MIARTPLRPEVSPVQKSSTPVPTGVTGPIPVMTTRRRSLTVRAQLIPSFVDDHVDGRADGLDLLHLVLGDLDVPLLLEGEHGLHQVERVGVQVLGEARVRHDLGLVHGELLGEHLADAGLDLGAVGHLVRLPPCAAGRSGPG